MLVGITFERPPAEESSARAERLSRLVDVLTVVKERLFLLADVIGSTTILEFYGWPPTCSPLARKDVFLRSPLWEPAAGKRPVPWTIWVDLKSGSTRGTSEAFLSFHAEVSVWTPPLSGCWPRWASC